MSTSAAQSAAFFEEAVARGKVWTVRDEQGVPAPRNGQGIRAMPFWSLRSRADKVVAAVPAYGGMSPVEIALAEFRERWLPDLESEGYHIGINWSGAAATGYDLRPDEVEARFYEVLSSSNQVKGSDREPLQTSQLSHQVVVQFPDAAVPDVDTLARSEELVLALLGDQDLYDGVHIGSGTVNFSVLTADRAALLLAVQSGSDWLAHPDIRIAARKLDSGGAEFKVLWPQGDRRDFRLSYGPGGAMGPGWRSRRVTGSTDNDAITAPPEPPSAFLPLTEGRVPGTLFQHRVHHLGQLRLSSGRLESCDPFVNLGEGLVVDVPPGDYDVYVTLADVSKNQDWSNLREAYLSVVLKETGWATSSFLTPVGWAAPSDNEYYGVPVDSGTVCFVDAGAVVRSMPATGADSDLWLDEVFDTERDDSWFALIDSPDHLIAGCANIVMPKARAGENVVLCRSGWGDGFYPVVGTYDSQGQLVGVHIDLQVDEAPGEPTS